MSTIYWEGFAVELPSGGVGAESGLVRVLAQGHNPTLGSVDLHEVGTAPICREVGP